MRNKLFSILLLQMFCAISACTAQEPEAYAREQKPSFLYVLRTGPHCDSLPLFSAAGFPKDTGSVATAQVRSGEAGTVQDISKDQEWYRIRLDDGREGWIRESCSGSELQVGGTDPRVFVTIKTATRPELKAYLVKRATTEGLASEEDHGIVKIDDHLLFGDRELGEIKIPWRDIKSIVISKDGYEVVLTTGKGKTYLDGGGRGIFSFRFGQEKLTKIVSGKTVAYSIYIWLVTGEVDIKLADLNGARLDR